ncbi:hypothetical protein AcW2_007612 [Taiwanofungus camphoratus]|nr:hypothetical protein AcW2_007612 [Antrodia cinnamomea]
MQMPADFGPTGGLSSDRNGEYRNDMRPRPKTSARRPKRMSRPGLTLRLTGPRVVPWLLIHHCVSPKLTYDGVQAALIGVGQMPGGERPRSISAGPFVLQLGS